MFGVGGILSFDRAPSDRATVRPICELVSHRGLADKDPAAQRPTHRIANRLFGGKATAKFQRALLPGLRWNQEILGGVLDQNMDSETRWLDAGCGHHLLGAGLEGFERKLKGKAGLIVGVDLEVPKGANDDQLLRACADLNHLPFADEAFDLISCNMVVEHLKNAEIAFREFARVLAPGGRLVIHTPNTWSYVVSTARMAKAVLPSRWVFKLIHWSESRESEDVFPTFYRANTMGRLKSLLREAGLGERSSRYLLNPHPIFWRFAPIALFELLLQRASLCGPLRFLRATLLVVYEKPGSGPPRPIGDQTINELREAGVEEG